MLTMRSFQKVCWSVQVGRSTSSQIPCWYIVISRTVLSSFLIVALAPAPSHSHSQLIPQIVLNYRRHHTIGLQPSMMLLWAFAGIPLGIYNVLSGDKSIALQVQPQILTSLSLVTWSQCIYYGHRWSVFKSGAALIALGSLLGAIEMAFILGFRVSKLFQAGMMDRG